MALFWKAAGWVLLSAVFCLILNRKSPDFGTILAMAVCCMVGLVAMQYLEEVMEFLYRLMDLANLRQDMLCVLLKAMGIALVAELSSLICADAGQSSLGKGLQILASAVILWLSIPVFSAFLELIREILEEAG